MPVVCGCVGVKMYVFVCVGVGVDVYEGVGVDVVRM